METFRSKYRRLEQRMKALAEAEGDVFLPNPAPKGPVDYVLICMEPSLGGASEETVRAEVAAGARNFVSSVEDFVLHHCARKYLCRPSDSYHITDFSKGAMMVDRANKERAERYEKWHPLLLDELELVGPEASVIAVGRAVEQQLERRKFGRPFTRIIHYSGQAARARNDAVLGYEDAFRSFRDSIGLTDLIATAEEVLSSAEVPARFRDRTLKTLARSQLTVSRKKLIFAYKQAFEKLLSKALNNKRVAVGSLREFDLSIGGFMGSSYAVKLQEGALIYEQCGDGYELERKEEVRPSEERWAEFWRGVDDLGVWRWQSEYRKANVMDGTSWSVTITLGAKSVTSSGRNAYPSDWDEFCASVRQLLDGRAFS